MYVWKLWRDSRARFLICLAVGMLWVGAAVYLKQTLGLPAATVLHALRHDPKLQQAAWAQIYMDLIPALTVIGLLVALALCETGLGRDFTQNTTEFLLTRPRRRRYFAWTGWLFGAAHVFALLVLMTMCGMGLLLYMSRVVLNWAALALPVLLLPSMLLLYGIGYMFAVVTNGRNGGVTAFGILLLYALALPLLYQYWHVRLPWWWFSSLPAWVLHHGVGAPFPWLALLGWCLFALVFPFIAQWSLQRKEI